MQIRLLSAPFPRTLPYRRQISGCDNARLCATRHGQLPPRCGATSVERGQRWLVGARPPIGAFHLSTPMAAKLTNHVRRANIVGQFVVVASASFVVVSSESRRSIGASENAVSYRTRPIPRACHCLGGDLLGREIHRWWVIIILSIAKTPTRPPRLAAAAAAASFFATNTVADRSAAIFSRGWTTPSFIHSAYLPRPFQLRRQRAWNWKGENISHASCIAGGTRTRPLLGNRTPCRASVAPCRPVDRCRSVSSAYVYYFIQYKIVFDHTRLEKIIHHVHTSQYTYVVFITFRSGIGHMRHDAPMVGERGREIENEKHRETDTQSEV